ncbi:hypothetical protein A9Q77_07350 [Marinomonas sp. 42_23_T18]|nr:hypothetical protein A9Q77_07350 [Marinomonas sp. 42_23_T18]
MNNISSTEIYDSATFTLFANLKEYAVKIKNAITSTEKLSDLTMRNPVNLDSKIQLVNKINKLEFMSDSQK